MTEREAILQNLRQLADGVVAMFGRNCEACIHDLDQLDNSLIYIQGDITGRKIGAPATDLLVRILNREKETGKNMWHYSTISGDGRNLKSTTTLFRNSSGKPVAAFCINLDTTDFYNACQTLMPFIPQENTAPTVNTETFTHSMAETVEALFHSGVEEIGHHPATMKVAEKTALIRYLEENGTFQLKGAVDQVANLMGVTRYTVYNYLKKIRNNSSQS